MFHCELLVVVDLGRIRDMSQNKTILIIDDENDIRESLTKAFKKRNLEVQAFESGNKAIQYLQSNTCDLVLSDSRMADGTGEEVLKYLRQVKKANTPFLFMTGFSETSESELLALGAQAVVAKPFSRSTLIEKCFELMGIKSE